MDALFTNLNNIATNVCIILVFYYLALDAIYLILLFTGFFSVSNYFKKRGYAAYQIIADSEFTPPVSVIVPAYNEEKSIVDVVHSLLSLNYPRYEIIVVNDGSEDATLAKLHKAFDLTRVDKAVKISIPSEPIRGVYVSGKYPKLIVLDKFNGGGKADALNAGTNLAYYPLVCAIDADTMLEKDALLHIVKPLIESNREIAAVGGIVRVANGCEIANGRIVRVRVSTNPLVGFQVIEYLRAFLAGRSGWSAINALLIISGAFGLFRKDLLIELGGFANNTLGEDAEMVVRLHKKLRRKGKNYRIAFIADPICWTIVPEDFSALANQRKRWHIGLIETLVSHIDLLLNPRYGTVGLLAMPYYFIFEMLGPFFEILGLTCFLYLLVVGMMSIEILLGLLVASLLFGTLVSVGAILIEEFSYNRYETWSDLALLILYSFIEGFGYRQILSFIRVAAFFDWLGGRREWKVVQKQGFTHCD